MTLDRDGSTPRVLHVINGLELGGAERVLVRLVTLTDRSRIRPAVMSLTTMGPLAGQLVDAGIEVESLGLRAGPTTPLDLARLVTSFRRNPPDLVHTWLYKSDLIGGLAATIARVPVAWNLRQTDLDAVGSTRANRAALHLSARLSRRVPAAITCVSGAARDHHVRCGYDGSRMTVIPNGFDTRQFRPDERARADTRSRLGIGPDAVVVGLIARLDPQKDHRGFLEAMETVCAELPQTHIVLAGTGVTPESIDRIAPPRMDRRRIHALGAVEDVAALTNALDLAVSASAYGEGFSNALGEALACGVCCVATDSGNARELVEESGLVVPPGDPASLARAIRSVLDWEPTHRRELGETARRRIEDRWSIAAMVEAYTEFHEEVISDVRVRRHVAATVV